MPRAGAARKRIFVVGTGRSGTTWMGEILASHPQIRTVLEPRPVFDWVTAVAVGSVSRTDQLTSIFSEYDRLFAEAAPFHFADKTHPALWIVDELAERYPDSMFIGMLREVEPTVASMLQHRGVRRWCEAWDSFPVPNRFLGVTAQNLEWYRQASLVERCVARWDSHAREIERLADARPSRVLAILYEDLVTDTRQGLDQIADFLGLDVSFPDAAPRRSSLSKWKSQLQSSDLDAIAAARAQLGAWARTRQSSPPTSWDA